MSFLEFFSEKKYKEIVEEIGPNKYQIFEKGESLPGVFFQSLALQNYNWVLAGTSSTLSTYTFTDYKFKTTIPKGEQLIIQRLLRFDDSHGDPHYNADDYVIFPTQAGHVFRMQREKAGDHFIEITNLGGMKSLAEAFHLPKLKHGPIQNYNEDGASLPIKIINLGPLKAEHKNRTAPKPKKEGIS